MQSISLEILSQQRLFIQYIYLLCLIHIWEHIIEPVDDFTFSHDPGNQSLLIRLTTKFYKTLVLRAMLRANKTYTLKYYRQDCPLLGHFATSRFLHLPLCLSCRLPGPGNVLQMATCVNLLS